VSALSRRLDRLGAAFKPAGADFIVYEVPAHWSAAERAAWLAKAVPNIAPNALIIDDSLDDLVEPRIVLVRNHAEPGMRHEDWVDLLK
jgi:hypothetical protein